MTVKIDRHRYIVSIKNRPVKLTPKEFDILDVLEQAKGKTVSRAHLLEKVWKYPPEVIKDLQQSRVHSVDSHVAHLRAKLRAAGEVIITVPHRGYRFEL